MRESFFSNHSSFAPLIPIIGFQREDVQALGEQERIFTLVTSSFGTAVSSTKKPLAMIFGEYDEPLSNSTHGERINNLAA